MKFKALTFLSLVLFFISCGVNPCDYNCNSGPLYIYFDLLDEDSRESIFKSGNYNIDNLTILDPNNENDPVEFDFMTENDLYYLVIGPFDQDTEVANYSFFLEDELMFNIMLNTSTIIDICCSNVVLEDFNVSGSDYEFDETSGIFKILISL